MGQVDREVSARAAHMYMFHGEILHIERKHLTDSPKNSERAYHACHEKPPGKAAAMALRAGAPPFSSRRCTHADICACWGGGGARPARD